MDCKKADEAILQYMDKTIKPSVAKSLALHLLECEPCREYFTALDMTMDELDAGEVEFLEAPPGFTEAVMAKVNDLPAYAVKKRVVNKALVFRVAGGLCAILMGVMLLLTSGVISVPALDGALTAIRAWASGVVAWFATDAVPFFNMAESSFTGMGISALLIAGVAVALLITLQRGERMEQEVNSIVR